MPGTMVEAIKQDQRVSAKTRWSEHVEKILLRLNRPPTIHFIAIHILATTSHILLVDRLVYYKTAVQPPPVFEEELFFSVYFPFAAMLLVQLQVPKGELKYPLVFEPVHYYSWELLFKLTERIYAENSMPANDLCSEVNKYFYLLWRS